RRHAAVDRDLQNELLHLLGGDAVGERAAHVQAQLLVAVEGDEQCHREKAPRVPRQARARPDLAPGVPGDELLELLVERGPRGERAVDVGVAEDRAPDGHALIVAFALVHGASYPRKSRSAALNASGASRFERWAASSSR